MTVETTHLLLRPWCEGDAVELQRLFSDPTVRGERSLPPDRIARLADASLRQWRINEFGPWAAIASSVSRPPHTLPLAA